MTRPRFSIPLHYQIIITLIACGFFGYLFPSATIYTNWIGVVFLRALNMIIIPLILCSITTGVASVGNADNFGATLIKIIPSNIFESLMQGQMLSIIFFAILFGFFITKVDEKPRILMTRLTTRT